MGIKTEFILDVIVKKLDLENEPYLTPEEIAVKFEWGEITLPITPSRINVTDFETKRSIEFQSNVRELRENLLNNKFKVTINRREKKRSTVHFVLDEGSDGKDDLGVQRNYDDDNIVAECVSAWPRNIVECLEDDDMPEFPYEQTYNLSRRDQYAGTITLAVMMVRKSKERKGRSDPSKPYVDKNGQLGIYQDLKSKIGENDAFFVIGNASQETNPPNLLGMCSGKSGCSGLYDSNRYKSVRGRLIDHLKLYPACGNMECCKNKDLFGEYETIVNKIQETSSILPLVKPCDQVFGSMADSAGITVPSDSSVHMPECPNGHRNVRFSYSDSETVSADSALLEGSNVSSDRTPKLKELVKKIIKISEKRQQKTEEIPHVCSEPKLTTSQFILKPRSCPICCEDISWVPALGSCPTCGFKPKMSFPAEKKAYDENQTAEQILAKWKQDIEKFKRKKDINPLGVCLCVGTKECINCHIRRISQKDVEEKVVDVNGAITNAVHTQNVKIEKCTANIVSDIVEDVLRQPLEERSNLELAYLNLNQDCLPSIPKAVQWSRKQFPSEKQDHVLDSESDISLRPRSSLFTKDHDGKDAVVKESSEKRGLRRDQKEKRRLIKLQKNRLKEINAYCKTKKEYPPRAVGHRYCLLNSPRVPKNMGWRWNLHIENERRGWRPGAIYKKTYKVMSYFLQKARPKKSQSTPEPTPEICAEPLTNKDGLELPRLHITKESGVYTVTLHPLRNPKDLTASMNPIQFKIEKSDGELKRRQIRQCLKIAKYLKCEHGSLIPSKDHNKDEYDVAIQNLKDMLCENDLRKICESESDSESSIDIEFGAGVGFDSDRPRLPANNVEVQVENDLSKPVEIPSRSNLWIELSDGVLNQPPHLPPVRPPNKTGERPPVLPGQRPVKPPGTGRPGNPGKPCNPGNPTKPGKPGKPKPNPVAKQPGSKPPENKPSGIKPPGSRPPQHKPGKPNVHPPDLSSDSYDGKKPITPTRPPYTKPHKPGKIPPDTNSPESHEKPPHRPSQPISTRPPFKPTIKPPPPDKPKPSTLQPSTKPPSSAPPRPNLGPPTSVKPYYDKSPPKKKRAADCQAVLDPCIESPLTFVSFKAHNCNDCESLTKEVDLPERTNSNDCTLFCVNEKCTAKLERRMAVKGAVRDLFEVTSTCPIPGHN